MANKKWKKVRGIISCMLVILIMQTNFAVAAVKSDAKSVNAQQSIDLQIGNKSVTVGGVVELLDVPPTILSGRTMLPLKFICEKLGLLVTWDAPTQTITIVKKSKEIVMVIGANEATIDGKTVVLEAPAVILSGRTMVPARFIAEATGAEVKWVPENQMVTIIPDGASLIQMSEPEKLPSMDIVLDNKNIVAYELSGQTGFENNKPGLKMLLDCMSYNSNLEEIAGAAGKAQIQKWNDFKLIINGENINTRNNVYSGTYDGYLTPYIPVRDLCEHYGYEYGYLTIKFKTSSGEIVPIRMVVFQSKVVRRHYDDALNLGLIPDATAVAVLVEGCNGIMLFGPGNSGAEEGLPWYGENYGKYGASCYLSIDPQAVVFLNNQFYFGHIGKTADSYFFRGWDDEFTSDSRTITCTSDVLNRSYYMKDGFSD